MSRQTCTAVCLQLTFNYGKNGLGCSTFAFGAKISVNRLHPQSIFEDRLVHVVLSVSPSGHPNPEYTQRHTVTGSDLVQRAWVLVAPCDPFPFGALAYLLL